jgi:hypothetical protein
MTLHRQLAVAVLGLVVAACSAATPPAGSIPTLGEAHGHLARIVDLARRGDFDGVCALGDGNCQRSLEVAGRDAVPPDPPTIVGTRVIPTTRSGDQTSYGGVVLVLCGIDGRGAHYDSEMLVFRDAQGLRAVNPIYWGRTRIAAGPTPEATHAPVSR